MSLPTERLDTIWQTYQAAWDSLKITRRVVGEPSAQQFLGQTSFELTIADKSEALLAESRQQLDDLFVLALWAEFEAWLVDVFRSRLDVTKALEPEDFGGAYHRFLDIQSRYWRVDDLLDVSKKLIDPSLVSSAKQIKVFRDWVAHGKSTRKASPSRIDPTTAYRVLSDMVRQVG